MTTSGYRTTRGVSQHLREPVVLTMAVLMAIASGYALALHSTLLVAIVLGAVGITTLIHLLRRTARLDLHGGWGLVTLFFVSGLTLRVRTTDAASSNVLDEAALLRIGLVALVGIGLLALASRATGTRFVEIRLGVFAPVAAFSTWALMTTLWSVNPAWTAYRSAEYLLGVLLFSYISTSIASRVDSEWYVPVKRFAGLVWSLYGFLLASAVVTALLFPNKGIVPSNGVIGVSIEGVFPRVSSNGVGSLAAMLALVLITRWAGGTRRPSAPHLVGIAGCILVLGVSQTRSALLGFLAGSVVILLMRRKHGLMILGCALGLVVFLALPEAETGAADYLQRGQTPEQIRTLTGRTDYWSTALELARERPVEGFGAYAAGRFLVARDFDPTLSSTHGAWPEVMVGQGVIGLALLAVAVAFPILVLVRAVRSNAIQSRQETWLVIEALALLAFLIVRSVFSVALIWHPVVDFLTVLLIADAYRRSRAT